MWNWYHIVLYPTDEILYYTWRVYVVTQSVVFYWWNVLHDVWTWFHIVFYTIWWNIKFYVFTWFHIVLYPIGEIICMTFGSGSKLCFILKVTYGIWCVEVVLHIVVPYTCNFIHDVWKWFYIVHPIGEYGSWRVEVVPHSVVSYRIVGGSWSVFSMEVWVCCHVPYVWVGL